VWKLLWGWAEEGAGGEGVIGRRERSRKLAGYDLPRIQTGKRFRRMSRCNANKPRIHLSEFNIAGH